MPARPLVRAVGPGEASRLAARMRELFLAAYADCAPAGDVAAYLDATFAPDRQALELADADRTTWVADDDGTWLGVVQVRHAAPCSAPTAAVRPAQLHRLYVAPQAQGTGLGGRLLDTARGAARVRGADGMWLSVWQQAPGPIGFYRRAGFRIAGTAAFPMGDTVLDDWIMEAPLAPSRS